MAIPKVYTVFNPPPCAGTVNNEPSLCQRQFAQSVEINSLIRRFIGGDTSVLVNRPPVDGVQDLRGLPPDRFAAELVIANGKSIWEGLPDSVKQTYGNAANFLRAYSAELEKQRKAAEVVDAEPKPGETNNNTSTPSSDVTAKAE